METSYPTVYFEVFNEMASLTFVKNSNNIQSSSLKFEQKTQNPRDKNAIQTKDG